MRCPASSARPLDKTCPTSGRASAGARYQIKRLACMCAGMTSGSLPQKMLGMSVIPDLSVSGSCWQVPGGVAGSEPDRPPALLPATACGRVAPWPCRPWARDSILTQAKPASLPIFPFVFRCEGSRMRSAIRRASAEFWKGFVMVLLSCDSSHDLPAITHPQLWAGFRAASRSGAPDLFGSGGISPTGDLRATDQSGIAPLCHA